MTTILSGHQRNGSSQGQTDNLAVGVFSVETLQGDQSPTEASDNEETSPSEQETDFEDISECEGSSIDDKHYMDDSASQSANGRPRRKKIFRRRKKEKIRNKLTEFRNKLEDALLGKSLKDEEPMIMVQNLKGVTLWGVPLLPSKGNERTDIILTKFLKAQGYKVDAAFENLRQTLLWRESHGIDHIIQEKLGDEKDELHKVVFIDSVDKDGHPLCFNLYGAFRNRVLYDKTFGTEEKRREFLKWRVQFMEKSIEKLDFKPGGVHSFLLISDMKNAPGPGNRMKELGPISKDAVSLFQYYYPELIYKHIIINAPFWYYLYHGVVTQYCTQGTRNKFVFARPYRVTETLLKYIAPENIPIQYGGLRRQNDDEFTSKDKPLEFSIRGGAVSTFQIPISDQGKLTLVWEVMVVGCDVTYKDEFIPDDEGSYKILLQKEKKMVESIRNSFYIHEPGKILITIKNATYIKKRVFIRQKAKLTLPVYMCTYEQT